MLLSKTAVYKNRNTGTGSGMRGMRGTRGMFTRIPVNLLKDSGECCYFIIPGNVEEDSGKCSRRFRGMFQKIPGNLNLDLFCEILLIFYQILELSCGKTKEYFSALLITTYN